MLAGIRQDLTVALRSALRRPVPSAAAVLCLAVGIGANAALYGAFGYFVLRPLPVGEPDRLVRVLQRQAGTADALDRVLSWAEVRTLRDDTTRLDGVAVFDGLSATLRSGELVEPVLGQVVSGDFFEVLQVPMQLGPGFDRGDRALGEPGTAVLSDSLWRRRFGADPNVVGRRVLLNEHPFEIVGVAAPPFRGVSLGIDLGIFVPLASRPAFEGGEGWETSDARSLQVLARLAPDATREAARVEAQAVFDAAAERPDVRRELAVLPERAGLIAPDAPGLLDAATLVAFGGVGLVLLVACANVGGLLLARAVSRRRELAVRIAVGASRARLARLLVAEGAVLALPATVAGLLLAHWVSDLWTVFLPPLPVPIVLDVAPDAGAAAYAAALGIATALLASAMPLRQSLRTDVVPALKAEAGGSVAAGGRRLLDGVVVAQLAFSASVLVLAGLFLATLAGVRRVDPGFDVEHTLFASLKLTDERHLGAEAERVQRELRERAAALPAVRAAALTSSAPITGLDRIGVRPAGADPSEAREVLFGVSSPGSFDALGVPLLEGRDFRDVEPEPVAVVSRTLARELWPDSASALGRFVAADGDEGPARVIGVAADYKYLALMDPDRPYLHLPLSRHPSQRVWLALSTRGAPEAPGTDVRALVAELDPLLQPLLLTGTQLVAAELWLPRTAAALAGAAAFTVLLLSAVGVLGATAFSVSRRARELGIRVALGASRRRIARLVLGRVMRLAAIGGALGLGASLGIAHAARDLLYGVTAWDPVLYGAAAAVLGAVALAAAWVPAARAARTAPAPALRAD